MSFKCLIISSKLTRTAIITICGLGGMGKSQIAIEFCYRQKDNYQYIFWMEADTEVTLQRSFWDAAAQIELSITTIEFVIPKMIQWFESNNRWLLVFNNADDFSFGNTSKPHALQDTYFPKIGHGVILMTTRIDDIGLRQKASIINLHEFQMDDQMALRLLLGKDIKGVNVDTYTY